VCVIRLIGFGFAVVVRYCPCSREHTLAHARAGA
jgi:hypothetical protein